MEKKFTLDNDHFFFAVSNCSAGYWAKDTDPISAALRCADGSNEWKTIRVIYAKAGTVDVNEWGSISYSLIQPPVAIGLFAVKGKQIRPATAKDNAKISCADWVNRWNEDMNEQRQEWMKKANDELSTC